MGEASSVGRRGSARTRPLFYVVDNGAEHIYMFIYIYTFVLQGQIESWVAWHTVYSANLHYITYTHTAKAGRARVLPLRLVHHGCLAFSPLFSSEPSSGCVQESCKSASLPPPHFAAGESHGFRRRHNTTAILIHPILIYYISNKAHRHNTYAYR